MCRLQHSLGNVWRPQTPPLTAPTSNRSGQPCRRGGPGGGAKQPCGTERKVPKQRLGPRVARGSARGYGGLLQCRPGAGTYRIRAGVGPCACLPGAKGLGWGCPGTGARSSRASPPAAEQACAPAPKGWPEPLLLGHSPGGLRPPAWPSLPRLAPLKAKANLPRPTGAPRPGGGSAAPGPPPGLGRPHAPLLRDLCSRRQAQDRGRYDTEGASVLLGRCECVLRTRQKSGREEGDWTPTNSGSVTASRACQSLSGPGGPPPRRAGPDCADSGLPLPEALV